jgi:hypothetical protein
MTRTYGKSAGDPAGTPEDPERCVVAVPYGWHSAQCLRKRGHGPNGEYCHQHDPESVKRRDAGRHMRDDARLAALGRRRENSAVGRYLRENNPDEFARLLALSTKSSVDVTEA